MKSKSDTLDFFRDPNVSRETANKNFMRNFECGKNDFMATKTYGLDMECYGGILNCLVSLEVWSIQNLGKLYHLQIMYG